MLYFMQGYYDMWLVITMIQKNKIGNNIRTTFRLYCQAKPSQAPAPAQLAGFS